MIVVQFIKAVRVGKDYEIEVDFNVSFKELQSFCTGNSGQEKMQAPAPHKKVQENPLLMDFSEFGEDEEDRNSRPYGCEPPDIKN